MAPGKLSLTARRGIIEIALGLFKKIYDANIFWTFQALVVRVLGIR